MAVSAVRWKWLPKEELSCPNATKLGDQVWRENSTFEGSVR